MPGARAAIHTELSVSMEKILLTVNLNITLVGHKERMFAKIEKHYMDYVPDAALICNFCPFKHGCVGLSFHCCSGPAEFWVSITIRVS